MNERGDLEKWKVLRLRERFSTTFTGQRNSFSHLVSRFGRFACDFHTWGMEFVELGAAVQQTINEIPTNLQSTVFRWSYWRCLATAAADRRRWVHGNGSTLNISHGFLAGKASLDSYRRCWFVDIIAIFIGFHVITAQARCLWDIWLQPIYWLVVRYFGKSDFPVIICYDVFLHCSGNIAVWSSAHHFVLNNRFFSFASTPLWVNA